MGTKISALPSAVGNANLADLTVIVQGGVTKQATVGALALNALSASTGASLVGFIQSGTGAGARTSQDKLRDVIAVNASDFTDGAGHFFSTTSTDAQNATALQNAVNSGAGVVFMNKGAYGYDTGLTVYNPITLCGAGTCTTNGAPSGNGTYLNYNGTGTGIIIGDNSATDKEGYHLRDFELTGTVSAANGIQVGAGYAASKWFMKSSIERVTVRNFTKTGAAGFAIDSVISSTFTQCYAQNNYYGFSFVAGGVCTNSLFSNCWARTNTNIGWYIQACVASTFHTCLSEANGDAGLKLWTNGVGSLEFINWYNTANNVTSGAAPVIIGGASNGPQYVNFRGGYFDNIHNPPYQFNLDYANYITWSSPTVSSFNSGWMTVTANTISCEFKSNAYPSLDVGNIAGWTPYRLRVDVQNISWTPAYSGTTGTVGTYTATVAKGQYSITGNRVNGWAELALSDKGSWTGTAQLSLPAAPGNVLSTGPKIAGSVIVGNATLTGSAGISLLPYPSTQIAYVEISKAVSSSSAELTCADCNNNSYFWYSFEYLI